MRSMRVLNYYSGGAAMALFSSEIPVAVVPVHQARVERVVEKRLNRVLAFTGLTIDDVVNNPVAKNVVLGYFKLSRMVDRRGEIVELERQWNPVG
jgi:hypothetical protein